MPEDISIAEIDRLRHIDEIADRFESDWRGAKQPRIEDYLGECPDDLRATLFRELLTIELEWRVRVRNVMSMENFIQRFGNYGHLVAAAFNDHDSSSCRNRPAQTLPLPDDKADIEIEPEDVRRTNDISVGSTCTETRRTESVDAKHPQQISRYEVLRLLGSGGMGDVYLAWDPQLCRQVALKVSRLCHDNATADRITRFHREARATAALQHPNICPVYDVGQADGLHFITMAYISGQSLQQRLTTATPLSHLEAAAFVRKLALAMQAAHDANVIHRDLKPSNIMITPQGEPIVMDFGLALLSESDHDARITHSGTLIGSPAYMSPEQTIGDPTAIGPGSDIYSLGVLFYEMLCGSLPFHGSIVTVIHQIRDTEAPSLQSVRADIDSDLQSIIEKMMSKSINDRYPSMQSVAVDLQSWIDKQSQQTEPQSADAIGSLPVDLAARSGVSPRHRRRVSERLADENAGKLRPSARLDDRAVRRKILLLTSLALLAAILATVITFRTPNGEVTIEVNDDRIGVELDGKQIKLRDARWTSPIKPGQHRFQVAVNNIQIPLADSQTIEIDGRTHRLMVSLGDMQLAAQEFEISRGNKQVLKIRLAPIEPSATSDVPARSSLKTIPTFVDDFNVSQVFQADRDTRFVAGRGQLIVTRSKPHPGGGWWAWSRTDIDNGTIDIDLRRVGTRGGWLIVLHNPTTRQGARVWLRDRQIRVGPSIWDPQQRALSATLEHVISDDAPLRNDGQFDMLRLEVADRSLNVILNGKVLGVPSEFPYDLTPSNLSLGIIGSKEGDCCVEYQRLEYQVHLRSPSSSQK